MENHCWMSLIFQTRPFATYLCKSQKAFDINDSCYVEEEQPATIKLVKMSLILLLELQDLGSMKNLSGVVTLEVPH
jgi:hypothetical protein